jgi:signal transduction histidine kinase
MSDPQSSSDCLHHADVQLEKRIRESVDILKSAMESKFNRLSEANRRLKRKIFDLYTIFELSRGLNSVLDLDALAGGMLSALNYELGIENIAVFLHRDTKKDKLSFFKLKGREPEFSGMKQAIHASGKIHESEISLTGELSRLLLSAREPLFLREIQSHIRGDNAEIEILRSLDCKLCVPLISKNRLLGILSLGPKKSDQRFSDNDLEFISVLAGQLTVAVENAILYENQKSINEQLRNTQKQLIQSEKLAAIGQISASLAHEINNPLGIVKNYLLILSENIEDQNPNHHNIKAINEEVDRIARIVRSFLDFSRLGKEEMVLLDIASILRQTIFLVSKEFLNRKIKIKTEVAEKLPQVLGSEDQLKQVFLNLLVNAKNSMPQGGEITISTQEMGQTLEIEFADTGCGISEEHISRIFDPFFTTKKEGEGTGLGLWICYEIIQAHGGNIQVRSKEKGASFLITLPKAQVK